MANFTDEIRKDILSEYPEKKCCRLAMLNALLTTSGTWDRDICGIRPSMFSFTFESERVSEYVLELIERTFSVTMSVKGAERDPKNGRDKLTFAYEGERAGAIIREILSHGLYHIGDPFRPCCAAAYVKGAFLGGGSCTLPRTGAKTGYHLEFIFSKIEDADFFRELLDNLQILSNKIDRDRKWMVYIKSREGISDFLSVIGALGALKTLEKTASAREERGRINRVENCIAGNADKAAIAAAAQIVALSKLKEAGLLSTLPEPLYDTACLRLKHPELSLGELAYLLGVTKSCLSHRMRKLMQIYEGSTK